MSYLFVDGEEMERKKINNYTFSDIIKLWFWYDLFMEFSFKDWGNHLYNHYFVSKKVRERWWRKLLCCWLIGWFIGSQWIFWFMNSQADYKRRETLASMCDERARMLQDQFNVSMNHVQALAILVSTFHHSMSPSAIDQMTFARYTERTLFERPLTSWVAYAVKVPHSEREEFERKQGWSIKKMVKDEEHPTRGNDSSFEDEPSPIKEEYAPVIFAQDTIKHVISVDLLTGKEDRDNILRARESGKGVLTAPFNLLKSNRLGVILTFAVYKEELPSNATPNERIESAIGYLGGVFDVETLVDKLLHQLACKQSIMVNVYDTTNHLEPISMYGSDVIRNRIYHNSSLNFGDPYRRHEMHCRFKHKRPLPWLAITTSIGSLVIALLVGYIFHATVNRIAKVEDEYLNMIELKIRAEAADVAKSQFLATVSHEIRTPMNGVLGMLQMLMDTNLDITQQDFVTTAQASGKALVALINEVLDQAKIESGKLELEAIKFDIREVLDDVLSLFSVKSLAKDLELAALVSDQVPENLIGDPGRFRQIITNLMGNSIKFTERGHILVTVNLAEEVMGSSVQEGMESTSTNTLSGYPVVSRRHSWEQLNSFNHEGLMIPNSFYVLSSDEIKLVISVEDTGSGIPKESQPQIFTPFMQVGPSIARIHGGTGIGLSISKCLIGLMKGEITVASEPEIGSTFTFTAVFSHGNHLKPNEHRLREFQGMRAVIVDPRLSRSVVTRYHLQRLGISVEIVTDPNQEISHVKNGTSMDVNMVLIEKDIWLKDTDSYSRFLGKLRNSNLPNFPRLFLLANPGNTCMKFVAKESSMGIVPTLVMKPLRSSMLASSLQRALGTEDKENHRHNGLSLSSLRSLLKGRNILVVDDNLVNLRVAAGALKKYGAEVARADSGKKAISMLKPPHQFDACFMDIQMPEMDGFEATKIIRSMESDMNDCIKRNEISPEDCSGVKYWHIPILAMTADVIQATHEKCLKCGMDGYVSKPFEGEELYREVARFFYAKKTQ
ncbi:Histidine kinase 3 [Zostera marina]|uniref:histidine kinase n=1 Tax=Zostera marina TaxID=29655 RepID=A0A0K9PL17_ZOSMR|nr:Histidine kinase 3 [Zostera marina]